jgi:hypothetical protein
MKKEIVFTDVTAKVPEAFYPTPSKMAMPEWIKKLQPYYEWGGREQQTAKRCLPLIDAVMLGYTIYTTADIRVTQTNGDPYFEWSHGLGIKFHAGEQTETHAKTKFQTPKWMSPWAIKTPRGYSTLFTSPLNHDNLPFEPFSAVVETDSYIAQVHIPFLLSDSKFDGVVEAGTPIAQVFPFAREDWNMRIKVGMTFDIDQVNQTISSKFKNAYRIFLRSGNSFS